jgi:hypothetical protein
MLNKHSTSSLKAEELISKIQIDFGMERDQVLLFMAEALAIAVLGTTQVMLIQMFSKQSNRLHYRRLRSVLDTLEKLGFLNFRD